MKTMRLIVLAALLFAVLCTLCGCQADRRGDNTLTLNLPGRNMDHFVEALQKRFPEINFDIYYYHGVNTTGFLGETIRNHDPSDIYYHTQMVPGDVAREELLDLSGYPFMGRIDRGMLNQFDVDGRIYQIPGPVSARCIAYNHTLFERYGWDVPESFDEMVALVEKIRVDAPDLIPIAVSLGGVAYPFTCVTTFSQAGFLSTPAGRAWEERYMRGEASVAEGWSEGLDMMARLIDSGAFKDVERFVGRWDYAVVRDCFAKGEAAMMLVLGGQSSLANAIAQCEYDLRLLPFYGAEKGQTFLCVTTSGTWGISSRLAKEGNEKKLKNALEVMDWLTTVEAQLLMVVGPADIPALKDAQTDQVSPAMLELWQKAANASKAPMIYNGYEDVIVVGGAIMQEYMLRGDAAGMKEAFVAAVDEAHAMALSENNLEAALGSVAEKFTPWQSTQLMANVTQTAGIADFTLASIGGRIKGENNSSGVYGWLYAGEVNNNNYNVLFPGRSSTCIEVVRLTGKEVRELLEKGKPSAVEGQAWPYTWCGLDVTYKGGRISGVRLQGKDLEDDREYRVAFMNGDYPAGLASGDRVESTSITLDELFIKYLAQNSPIRAPQVLRK